jgi:UDP-glucose 4-epimerase
VNVLVSGGAGFIGSHIVDVLVDAGHDVVVVDNLMTGRRANVHRRAMLHVTDIRDPQLRGIVESIRPEVVVHAAAQISVSRSVADPMTDASINVLGTIALLEHCRHAAVRRVVYISTGGAAYGDTDVIPTPETHPTRPASPYGMSKVAAEGYVDFWRALNGRESVVLRLANVYGPRQSPEGEAGVVAIFIDRARAGQTCIVNGDGHQTRDFVFVGDVAAAVHRAVELPSVGGTLNIGTGRETSVNQIVTELRAVIGREFKAEHGPAKAGEQRRSALDPRLAQARLGWQASTSLTEGLRLTAAHASTGA